MTRRRFIEKLVKACSAIVVGVCWVSHPVRNIHFWKMFAGYRISNGAPRRFVWAVRTKGYPGSLRALQDINKQAKWSG